jgi:hypothetical protein
MLNPYYISGFVDGEGCFSVAICNDKTCRTGHFIQLAFEIELREDDREILEKIKDELGCGNIYRLDYKKYEKWMPHVKLKISKFQDVYEKVIPFFKKYPLQGKKKDNFRIFCEVAEIVKEKRHLTNEGIEEIRKLKKSCSNKKQIVI